MGKAEFLTPKAIGNRIKAKGLQKLRWYCQMCQKQCRDENGFKCHCMSESHQRQLLLASENPNQFMSYFSQEFKSEFVELLRRRFGFCKVDETPKGWYIQWIDRDPETIRRQEELERKKKQDLDDVERSAKFIEEQVRRGREGKEPEMEEQKKKSVQSDHWIRPNIVVKVVTKRLGEKYFKKKAIIREVQNKYTAMVKMIDSGDKLKLDQSHVETVIPAPGKRVLILNGQYKDTEAILEGIDEHKFSATLVLDSGRMKGKTVERIAYEDFSKLA
ncbi:DNA/RNA-binding protein KIN17 [Triplophysa tibetana]|uniref:DNA/RNA-binding protein KIN17 n=1 Tax=Triplophysa tibetana TaxID=1572043 RepID=A0A5A9PFE9_9TELE|nr:DNA/RNA-binding protein KIN17 [Triplophysa tibetana]